MESIMNLAVIVFLAGLINLSEGTNSSHMIYVKTGDLGNGTEGVSIVIDSNTYLLEYDDPSRSPFTGNGTDSFEIDGPDIDVELIDHIDVLLEPCAQVTQYQGNTGSWNLIKIVIKDVNTGNKSRCICDCMIPNCFEGITTLNCSLVNVVHGGWGPWMKYTSSVCSRTCGSGTIISSYRDCNNPAPQNGGRQCVGDIYEIVPCNTQCCPGEYPITTFTNSPKYTIGSPSISLSSFFEHVLVGRITGLQNLTTGTRIKVNGPMSSHDVKIKNAVREFCDSSVYRMTKPQPSGFNLRYEVSVSIEDDLPLCLDNSSYVAVIPPTFTAEMTGIGCDEIGWRKNLSTDSSCFKLVSTVHHSWDAARLACIAEGADLATFSSQRQQNFILQLAHSGSLIWIGLTSKLNDIGRWEWINGTSYEGYITTKYLSYTAECAYLSQTGIAPEACSQSNTVVCERRDCTKPCCTNTYHDFAITGYNDLTIQKVTMSQCIDTCATSNACENVEYWSGDNSCVISETSLKDAVATDIGSLNIDKRVNFYETHCKACRGNDIVPHDSDSNTYYKCIDGVYVEHQCQSGMYMDYQESVCVELPVLTPLEMQYGFGSLFITNCEATTPQSTVTTTQSTVTTTQSTV
ncbi:unnamed protein product, partial [Owenia fusiformis]